MLSDLIKEPFLGFSEETVKFFKSLKNKKNNNKIWFEKHREEYDNYVKAPMRNLIDTMAVELPKIDKDFIVSYKSIFRINRDIRFSKDKTPYKDYCSAAFCLERIKSAEIPHLYFHLHPDELIIAAGQYSMDPVNLKKIRYKIFSEFGNYLSIIEDRNFKKLYGEVRGMKQQRPSKDYAEVTDEKLIEVLKMKQFYVYKTYEPKLAFDSSFIELLLKHAKVSLDFNRFLWEAIK